MQTAKFFYMILLLSFVGISASESSTVKIKNTEKWINDFVDRYVVSDERLNLPCRLSGKKHEHFVSFDLRITACQDPEDPNKIVTEITDGKREDRKNMMRGAGFGAAGTAGLFGLIYLIKTWMTSSPGTTSHHPHIQCPHLIRTGACL